MGSQSPSQQRCMLLVAHLSITSFRTSFALLLQYFESAVPTDRRAYSLDIDCFGALKGGEQHTTITERIHSPCVHVYALSVCLHKSMHCQFSLGCCADVHPLSWCC